MWPRLTFQPSTTSSRRFDSSTPLAPNCTKRSRSSAVVGADSGDRSPAGSRGGGAFVDPPLQVAAGAPLVSQLLVETAQALLRLDVLLGERLDDTGEGAGGLVRPGRPFCDGPGVVGALVGEEE